MYLGAPDNGEGKSQLSKSYIKNCFKGGRNRNFQQDSNFLFYSYSFIVRSACGTISFLADRSGLRENDDPIITVAEATEFLRLNKLGLKASSLMSETKLSYLMSRMRPYASVLEGSALHMAQMQRQLLSLISSPLTTSKSEWNFFFTTAQPDHHTPLLYDNCITSSYHLLMGSGINVDHTASIIQRRDAVDQLTTTQRLHLLKHHPILCARLFDIQQQAYFEIILCGQDAPLGQIDDFWRRGEFQGRGTVHSHNLICTRHDGVSESPFLLSDSPTDEEIETFNKFGVLVAERITARLQSRAVDDVSDLPPDVNEHLEHRRQETAFSFFPTNCKNSSETHPSLQRFTSDVDYSYDKTTNEIKDATVQRQYRRQQLHSQMHHCTFSCFKKCKPGHPRICRFHFPQVSLPNNTLLTVVSSFADFRGRKRFNIAPPRNNCFINQHIKSPLGFLCNNSNSDLKKIDAKTGSAVYASQYSSKADQPDSDVLQNLLSVKLSQRILQMDVLTQLSNKQLLYNLASAISQSQTVGAVQAGYLVLGLNIVNSTRKNVNANTLQRRDINFHTVTVSAAILTELDEDDSAVNNSPCSQLGRRNAYHILYLRLIELYGSTTITFFAFLSSYTVAKTSNKSVDPPELVVDDNGIITNAKSFVINKVRYI